MSRRCCSRRRYRRCYNRSTGDSTTVAAASSDSCSSAAGARDSVIACADLVSVMVTSVWRRTATSRSWASSRGLNLLGSTFCKRAKAASTPPRQRQHQSLFHTALAASRGCGCGKDGERSPILMLWWWSWRVSLGGNSCSKSANSCEFFFKLKKNSQNRT